MVGNRVQAILDPKPVEESAKKKREEAVVEAAKRTHGSRGPATRPQRRASSGVSVVGSSGDDLLVRLAHCCNPVAGDGIVGFITRGRGVSVHRATCPNVKGLMEHPERMIEVEWTELRMPDSRWRSWSSASTAWACSKMSPSLL